LKDLKDKEARGENVKGTNLTLDELGESESYLM
jgi:hypothetical protein